MGRGGAGESGRTKSGSISRRMYNQKRRGQGYSRGRGGQGRGGHGHGGGGQRYGGWDRKLSGNMSGFLCSCNMNEKDCVKEAMNLLNEYVQEEDMDNKPLSMPAGHGSVEQAADTGQAQEAEAMKKEEDVSVSGVDEEDIEDALKAEIHQLKSQSVRSRFVSMDTGVPNLVFISSTVKDPPGLAHRILEDIQEKKELKARFLLRLLPIEMTCRASMDELEGACRRLFPKYFSVDFTSYQILYKSRYNSKMDRGGVIKLLAEIVSETNPLNVVDLTNPKLSVIVEVVRNIVCIGVVRDFVKLKKFNLHEVVGEKEAQPPPGGGGSGVGESKSPGGDEPCGEVKSQVELPQEDD